MKQIISILPILTALLFLHINAAASSQAVAEGGFRELRRKNEEAPDKRQAPGEMKMSMQKTSI